MKNPLVWQPTIFTVSSLTGQIKRLINNQFRDILVEGEISNFKLYPSGHLYFTLKDDQSVIKAVMFNFYGRYPEDAFKDGTSVICSGRVDVYEKRGEYRLIVDVMEVKGLGLLQLKFQLLKEKLYKEGLFDHTKKRVLPLLPERIGIITSPAGAAIKDMLKIIFGRFPNMSVLIYPVRVQGDEASYEIVDAIRYFNLTREVDVIILGRGGGSTEDLAPFNEEMVARAIYASNIPIVSGVGHETDFTIADFVADVRAPTPTAAASIVVPDKEELKETIERLKKKLTESIKGVLEKKRLDLFKGIVALKERRDFLITHRIYLDDLTNRLTQNFTMFFINKRQKVLSLEQRLSDLNPENILKRGFSITTKKSTKEVIINTNQVDTKDVVSIKLFKGMLECTVDKLMPVK
ncbi:MAG TPA: exodeoxyribonuclease VII large subunit [Syntrophorhabdaceae bacterium]|nr:exodeoxyribonuclease VII large subunit [Syntrophorhabdaceae bacterium]